jgi:ABC-type Co2+ transport system permease subunit
MRPEHQQQQLNVNVQNLIIKAIKYIIEGLAVAVAAYYIPKNKLNVEDIVSIGVTAAAIFAVLDVFSPSTGEAVRFGAGFGIGANQVGFRPL